MKKLCISLVVLLLVLNSFLSFTGSASDESQPKPYAFMEQSSDFCLIGSGYLKN